MNRHIKNCNFKYINIKNGLFHSPGYWDEEIGRRKFENILKTQYICNRNDLINNVNYKDYCEYLKDHQNCDDSYVSLSINPKSKLSFLKYFPLLFNTNFMTSIDKLLFLVDGINYGDTFSAYRVYVQNRNRINFVINPKICQNITFFQNIKSARLPQEVVVKESIPLQFVEAIAVSFRYIHFEFFHVKGKKYKLYKDYKDLFIPFLNEEIEYLKNIYQLLDKYDLHVPVVDSETGYDLSHVLTLK